MSGLLRRLAQRAVATPIPTIRPSLPSRFAQATFDWNEVASDDVEIPTRRTQGVMRPERAATEAPTTPPRRAGTPTTPPRQAGTPSLRIAPPDPGVTPVTAQRASTPEAPTKATSVQRADTPESSTSTAPEHSAPASVSKVLLTSTHQAPTPAVPDAAADDEPPSSDRVPPPDNFPQRRTARLGWLPVPRSQATPESSSPVVAPGVKHPTPAEDVAIEVISTADDPPPVASVTPSPSAEPLGTVRIASEDHAAKEPVTALRAPSASAAPDVIARRIKLPSGAKGAAPNTSSPATIRVTIGRVDIRATTPEPAAPAAPRRPRLTLDDYLAARSGRAR